MVVNEGLKFLAYDLAHQVGTISCSGAIGASALPVTTPETSALSCEYTSASGYSRVSMDTGYPMVNADDPTINPNVTRFRFTFGAGNPNEDVVIREVGLFFNNVVSGGTSLFLRQGGDPSEDDFTIIKRADWDVEFTIDLCFVGQT